jgi:protein-S-isoprenylcysteine O-methyltransferase Ste14
MTERKTGFAYLLFKYRSYTPIPFIILALIFADPGGWPFWVGLALMVLGEAIRIWALGYIGPVSRTDVPLGESLVSTGPYAYTRNPLYIGNFLITVGAALYSGALLPWLPIAVAMFFIVQYIIIIPLEEAGLKREKGEAFADYLKKVPAVFPRLTPYTNRSTRDFEAGQALNGEVPTLHTIFMLVWIMPLAGWVRMVVLG